MLSNHFVKVALLAALAGFSPVSRGLCEALPAAAAAPADRADDQGVLVLSVAGRQIGTEKFTIRSTRGKVEAEAQIELHIEREGQTFDFQTLPKLVLNADLQPLTYTWTQKGSESSRLEVDFRSTPVKTRYRTVSGDDDQRDFELPKDVVVLDDNVIHHYQLLVNRYRMTAGGAQSFQAFIPQEALPGVVSVEETGAESVEIDGHTETLRHLVVSTELARVDLWVDNQHRLRRVSIPAAQLEAVRKK